MNKALGLLILIILPIAMLTANEPELHKIRAKHFTNEITSVKLLLKNEMLTQEEAKDKNIPQHFIKNVRFFDGNTLVYNAVLSPYVAKNPVLKFQYLGKTSSIGRLETIDNNHLIRHENIIIKQAQSPKASATLKNVLEDKKTLNIFSASVQKHFGKRTFIKSNNIKIHAPDITPNPHAVMIKIHTNIRAKSVTLFAPQAAQKASYLDKKDNTIVFDNNDLALVYKYFAQEQSLIDFEVKIKLSYAQKSKVLVVVEGKDGMLYMAEKPIVIATCINSGG